MKLGEHTPVRAFTIAEMILTMAILLVVVLAMMGLAIASVRVSTKSTDSSRAIQLGRQYLEAQIESALSDNPGGTRDSFFNHDHPTTPWRSQEIALGQNRFQVSLRVQTVQDETTGQPLGTRVEANNRLKKVDAIVTWWEGAGNPRDGYGRLETRLSRLVGETQP